MFMGTLTGPFYSHLLGNSSSGFTDLILTGERVKSGIQSGKIQIGSSSGTTKRPISGRNEVNTMQSQKGRKNEHHQSVGAVLISATAPLKDQPPKYTRRPDAPRRNFTKISMPISQALQHLLKADLITLKTLRRMSTLPLRVIAPMQHVRITVTVKDMTQITVGP